MAGNIKTANQQGSIPMVDSWAREQIQSLTEQAGSNGSQTVTLGKAVYLGDSIGAGYKNPNDYGVAKALEATGRFSSLTNGAASGTTFGPYSIIGGTSGYDCISQIERYRADIASADIIYLEYGGNDIKAVAAGVVTYTQVVGYAATAVSNILTLNPNARIIFLLPSRWYSAALNSAVDTAENYIGNLLLLAFEKMNIQCINLAEGTVANFINKDSMWQSDHTHPLPAMCDRIARHVVDSTVSGASARCAWTVPVAFLMSGTTSATNPYGFDTESIRFFLMHGVNVPLYMIVSDRITMIAQLTLWNIDVAIQWICHYNDSSGKHPVHIDLRNDGSIVFA